MSESINSNYCLLLEKFIDAGLDFDFDFQNNELGGWWEIPDKNLLLENLKAIDFSNMSPDLINDDAEYYLDLIAEMHKTLIGYLDNSYKFFCTICKLIINHRIMTKEMVFMQPIPVAEKSFPLQRTIILLNFLQN
ncbi:Uncharacterised protein [Moraxella lacunata]|uniref:Uncharacterized protein n=2 Tax=Moraxella lacunata TaxID=477 RepID=A0A378UBY5_MORLA|nr:Uncharacterised protein [Moraxella lacunata]